MECTSPYQPRQLAAIEVLPNQFGVSQGYYARGEGGPTSAPTYTSQSLVGCDSLASPYDFGITYSTASSSSPAFGPQGSAYISQTAPELDNVYGFYQNELRRTFESVRDSNLTEAGNSLKRISDWLLGNAEALGLVRDDESIHTERLKFWNEFNLCWLAVFQKQRELTTEMHNMSQCLDPPQSIMKYDQIESMGEGLVRLCDALEKHGLVDYQIGVSEEEIMIVLMACLNLMKDQRIYPAASLTQSSASQRR